MKIFTEFLELVAGIQMLVIIEKTTEVL